MLEYYRHSGRFTLPGLAKSLVLTTAAVLVLAFVNASLFLLIPNDQILGLLGLVICLILGFCIGWALKKGKVRNTAVALIFSAAASLEFIYAGWALFLVVGFPALVAKAGLSSLLFRPKSLWEITISASRMGVVSPHKYPTVDSLITVGGLLAIVSVWACILFGYGMISGGVFCERCSRWADNFCDIVLKPPADIHGLVIELENGNFSYFDRAESADPNDQLEFEICSCPVCDSFVTMSMDHHTIRANKYFGLFPRKQEKQKTLLNHLLITPTLKQKVMDVLENYGEAQSASTAAEN